jgi:3,4-dihydroxy 2-butanone 4-phosphate synthase/GTP cyclohydrolase II
MGDHAEPPATSSTVVELPAARAARSRARASNGQDRRPAGDGQRLSAAVRSIECVLEELRAGRMVVVRDDEARQNSGDLTIAAQFAGPDAVNFMATHGRGLVCLALTAARCDELRLAPMAAVNESRFGTAFTVSIEARRGVTTGISAFDRARTVAVAVDPLAGSADVVSPGHVFPLRARPGGVLERPGQTEAAVDLARLAGLQPAGVICPILSDDGSVARGPELERFCRVHGLASVDVAELIAFRRDRERFVERLGEVELATRFGSFRQVAYRAPTAAADHVALVRGEVRGAADVLVHIHVESLAVDVFGAVGPDRDLTVEDALREIDAAGRGVLVYLAREHRRADVVDRLGAHELPRRAQGAQVPGAPRRRGSDGERAAYGAAAAILADLGVASVRLLTNDPGELGRLAGLGLDVAGQFPAARPARKRNHAFLAPEARELGHLVRA